MLFLAVAAIASCGKEEAHEDPPYGAPIFGEGEGEANEGEGEANEGEGEPAPTETVCIDVVFAGDTGGFNLLNELSVGAPTSTGTELVAAGGDPYMALDRSVALADCGRLELTYSVDAGTHGQIFWSRTGDAWFDEERNRFFPITADGLKRTVVVELADHPLWNGELTSLRLDPTNAAATIHLQRIRLVGPPPVSTEGEGEGEVPGEGEGEVPGEGEGEDPGPDACDPGFVVDGARCIPLGPTALTRRGEAEVCERFNADYQWVDEWEPTAGSVDQCDEGNVPQDALDNGLRRVNLYRWLAGVEPAALAPELFPQQQACSTMMAAYGRLTHQPTPDIPCYSDNARAGAGSSNIAGGGGIAGSVDMYMQDFGAGNAQSLGHRRWTIGPFMSVTQFGVKNSFSCMYSFGIGGGSDPGFVAWPPAGIVPVQAPAGDFHFESNQFAPTNDTTVEVAVDAGAFATVEHRILVGNYGHYGTALAFAPTGGVRDAWVAGKTIRVRINGTRGGNVEYTTKFTGCGG
ncbi:MAG: hypothetical protein Q8O67_33195 [Deltaproteobacteria bacterium]|nr:hypothetical protein [Deltaproteobacteria bacterium]